VSPDRATSEADGRGTRQGIRLLAQAAGRRPACLTSPFASSISTRLTCRLADVIDEALIDSPRIVTTTAESFRQALEAAI
jgi:hypothetical protein